MDENEFASWCRRVAQAVGEKASSLQDAHEFDRTGQLGDFTNNGRFIVITPTAERRVLISGAAAVPEPLTPGKHMPKMPVLFPGGLAVTVLTDDEGTALVVDAIVAWLNQQDHELEGLRHAFRRHNPRLQDL